MSAHVYDDRRHSPNLSAFSYPHASAPDIIRSHQKDTYFQSQLSTHLTSVLRSIRGARFTHTYATDLRTLADLLYLCLTTLLGNRTLGEEYCDIVQLSEAPSSGGRLPEVWRRGAYIFGSVLVPYGLQKLLPSFRRRLRAKLEISLRRRTKSTTSKSQGQIPPQPTKGMRLQQYVLNNLDTLTSPSPIYAVSLAAFYFSGAYYHLGKRLFGLRYIFTRRLEPHEQRGGYEILGVLLALQLAVQGYLHAKETLDTPTTTTLTGGERLDTENREAEFVSLDSGAYASNTTLLFSEGNTANSDPATQKERISALTHTPFPLSEGRGEGDGAAGSNLENSETMGWIESSQQRKCTLCLEAMKDPSVTTCGHVFCWGCICDWLAEKAECPLCRQGVMVQKILLLRG